MNTPYSYLLLLPMFCLAHLGSTLAMENPEEKDGLETLYQASLRSIGAHQNPQLEQFKHLAELNVSKSGLKELPCDITRIKPLRRLDVSDNGLTALPDLNALKKLSILKIGDNHFVVLPATVTELPNLRTLDARHNNLTTLPDTMGDLQKLKKFNVSHNNLTELPASLRKLTNLRVFDAEDNQLSKLPDLARAHKLQRLNLMHNRIGAAAEDEPKENAASMAMALYRTIGRNCMRATHDLLTQLRIHKTYPHLRKTLERVVNQATNTKSPFKISDLPHMLALHKKFSRQLKHAAGTKKKKDPTYPAAQKLHKCLHYYRWITALQKAQKAYITNPFDTTEWHSFPKEIKRMLWSYINEPAE